MQSTKTTIILTTAILLFTILTAGCTDTGGANPETVKYTVPPEEVAVVEETAAVVEDIPESTETNWWDDDPEFNPAVINAKDNLFGVEIYGIKYQNYDSWYTLQDDNKNMIFVQEIYTPSTLRLDLKLLSDQYRTLIAQYGSMISVTMETIDLDQDGAMDKVAVKYVGTDGVLEFETEYKYRWQLRDYLITYLNDN